MSGHDETASGGGRRYGWSWGRRRGSVFLAAGRRRAVRDRRTLARQGRATGRVSSPRRPTSTSTPCSRPSARTSSLCVCPTRATSTRRCGSSRPAIRCWSRSRSCSTSARPTDSCAAAADRDLFFAINFNHRYARPVELARAAIDAGALGQITFATWRFGGEVGTSTNPYANLIETQCHGFDMLEHLCGPIGSVERTLNDPIGHGLTTLAVAPHLRVWRRGHARRHLRLVLRVPGHALRRSQRHRRPSAGRRHGPAFHRSISGSETSRGVGGRLLQRPRP